MTGIGVGAALVPVLAEVAVGTAQVVTGRAGVRRLHATALDPATAVLVDRATTAAFAGRALWGVSG